MEIVKKLTKTGTSLCIIIDKVVLNTLKLKRGDKVRIDIKKEKNVNE